MYDDHDHDHTNNNIIIWPKWPEVILRRRLTPIECCLARFLAFLRGIPKVFYLSAVYPRPTSSRFFSLLRTRDSVPNFFYLRLCNQSSGEPLILKSCLNPGGCPPCGSRTVPQGVLIISTSSSPPDFDRLRIVLARLQSVDKHSFSQR